MNPDAHAAPAQGDDPRIGTLIADRYRLIERLGEGATGAVYRGVHEALRKPVAVKLLGRGARADAEMVARFQREAVAAANLKHQNIAEATDSGQMPDGTWFLVMEYVKGQSLRAILAQHGKLPPARALHLIRQVASAIAFAHASEVVHRDLKPENIVVFDQGEERDLVKVIDFGIARMRSSFGGGPSGLTKVGMVVGTLEYMSPEQAMGQPVDGRADQYALGVIAFEMLTGEPPYTADDVASLVYKHVGAPIPSVTERAPELPAAVDAVVAKMMGKLPDERFASVSEAARALAEAIEHRREIAPPAAPRTELATPVPGADVATPVPAGRPPRVTASGTVVVAEPPPAVAVEAAAPAGARTQRELPLVLISVIAGAVVLAVVVVILVVRAASTESSEGPASASDNPTSEPPTLAPTSHDKKPGAPSRGKPSRKKGRHD